jgi:hypothetical protein
MSAKWKIVGTIVAVAFAVSAASAAFAQASGGTQTTPFNYDIKDGQRVAKVNRVNNADGSWREENRKGGCVEIKEKSASGDLKITRKCD